MVVVILTTVPEAVLSITSCTILRLYFNLCLINNQIGLVLITIYGRFKRAVTWYSFNTKLSILTRYIQLKLAPALTVIELLNLKSLECTL